MLNSLLLWLLAVPVVLGLALWYFNRATHEAAIQLSCIFAAVAMVLTLGAFYGSKGAATSDVEIWNGMVTSKDRLHGTYEQPYDCNCTTTRNKDGTTTTSCQTCYETHYTVEWTCNTTIGGFRIDKLDRTSRRVYDAPNPARWSSINIGDPAAKTHRYTNYIQAVPNSLFTPSSEALKAKFAALTPPYPDNVYDFYRIDRVLTPGFAMPDIAQWNQDLSMMLRELGPKKQVNVSLVIVKTNDPNYEYALRDAWEGANKNDVVVVVGTTQFPNIEWVRVISWTKSEIFKVELRDRLMEMGVVNRQMIPAIGEQIAKNFERRHMAEFEYLDGEIDPPTWVVIALLVVLIGGAAGTHFYGFRNTSYGSRNRRFR